MVVLHEVVPSGLLPKLSSPAPPSAQESLQSSRSAQTPAEVRRGPSIQRQFHKGYPLNGTAGRKAVPCTSELSGSSSSILLTSLPDSHRRSSQRDICKHRGMHFVDWEYRKLIMYEISREMKLILAYFPHPSRFQNSKYNIQTASRRHQTCPRLRFKRDLQNTFSLAEQELIAKTRSLRCRHTAVCVRAYWMWSNGFLHALVHQLLPCW